MTIDIAKNVKVSKSFVLSEAYKDIHNADKKVGNLAVYATDDTENPIFHQSRRFTAVGRAINLGYSMLNQGATEEEMIRFFRYYNTLLARPALHLDYVQAEKENNITELRSKYGEYRVISE